MLQLKEETSGLLDHAQLLDTLSRVPADSDFDVLALLGCSSTNAVIKFLYGARCNMNSYPDIFHPSLEILPDVLDLLRSRDSTWWLQRVISSPNLEPAYFGALVEGVPGLAWAFNWWYHKDASPIDLHQLLTDHFRTTGASLDLAWALFEDRRSVPEEQAVSLAEFCTTLAALTRATALQA
jgi:hypothetical protein